MVTFAGLSFADIKKPVEGEKLEQILLEAAEELGYKAKLVDEKIEKYEIGSLKKIEEYQSTKMKLRKKRIPIMEVSFDKHFPRDLSVNYGLVYGLSTKGTMEKYLGVVSKRLEEETAAAE